MIQPVIGRVAFNENITFALLAFSSRQGSELEFFLHFFMQGRGRRVIINDSYRTFHLKGKKRLTFPLSVPWPLEVAGCATYQRGGTGGEGPACRDGGER